MLFCSVGSKEQHVVFLSRGLCPPGVRPLLQAPQGIWMPIPMPDNKSKEEKTGVACHGLPLDSFVEPQCGSICIVEPLRLAADGQDVGHTSTVLPLITIILGHWH